MQINDENNLSIHNSNNFNNDINNNNAKFIDKPNQPKIDFPANKQKRKFQAKWYNEFSWLEYDTSSDAAFCFICKQYPIKASEKTAFKSTGFKDWHNAKKMFKAHENSESHETNKMFLFNRVGNCLNFFVINFFLTK